MMNKTERETYERALKYAKEYKERLDKAEQKINNIKGFCIVSLKNRTLIKSEIHLLDTILQYV